jgi:hypothetical protein
MGRPGNDHCHEDERDDDHSQECAEKDALLSCHALRVPRIRAVRG